MKLFGKSKKEKEEAAKIAQAKKTAREEHLQKRTATQAELAAMAKEKQAAFLVKLNEDFKARQATSEAERKKKVELRRAKVKDAEIAEKKIVPLTIVDSEAVKTTRAENLKAHEDLLESLEVKMKDVNTRFKKLKDVEKELTGKKSKAIPKQFSNNTRDLRKCQHEKDNLHLQIEARKKIIERIKK